MYVLCVGDGRRKALGGARGVGAGGGIKGDAIRRHDTIAENIFGAPRSVMDRDSEWDPSDRRGPLLEKKTPRLKAIKHLGEVGVAPKWTAGSPERPSRRTTQMTACCRSVGGRRGKVVRGLSAGGRGGEVDEVRGPRGVYTDDDKCKYGATEPEKKKKNEDGFDCITVII